MRPILLAAALFLCLSGLATADVVYLTTGRTIKGTVVKEDARQVVIKTPKGKLTLPRHLVKKIERQSKGATRLALGRERASQGDYATAEKLFEKASRDPDRKIADEARRELATLRGRKKTPPPADPGPATPEPATPEPAAPLRASPKADELRLGGGGFAREVRAREVVLAIRAGDPRRALRLLKEVEASWKDDRAFRYLRGRAHEANHRDRDAKKDYLSLLASVDVDRRLPAAQLGELLRREFGGETISKVSPGVQSPWKRLTTNHFTIFHPFSSVEAWFSRAPEEALDDVLEQLKIGKNEVHFSGKIQILLYESKESYEEQEGMKLAGGHASVRWVPDGVLKVIAAYPNRRVYTDTYRHEIAHTVLLEMYRGMPSWAHEGAAEWCEPPRSKGRLRTIVKGQRESGKLPSLLTFMRDEVPRGDDELAVKSYYGQCTVTFDALAELSGGPRKAMDLCLQIGQVGPERALTGAGISLERLDTAWKKHAAKRN